MTEQAAKDLLIAELLDKRPLRWWDVETIHQHVRLSKTQAHTSRRLKQWADDGRIRRFVDSGGKKRSTRWPDGQTRTQRSNWSM